MYSGVCSFETGYLGSEVMFNAKLYKMLNQSDTNCQQYFLKEAIFALFIYFCPINTADTKSLDLNHMSVLSEAIASPTASQLRHNCVTTASQLRHNHCPPKSV